MIFDVKVDLRGEFRLVIGGHIINLSRHKVYASIMELVLFSILMKIAATNNLEVMTGDMGNLYLNANTEENIYTRVGAKFELVCIISKGSLLDVFKALYVLPTSEKICYARLSHTLRAIIFKPTRFYPDVCIRGRVGGYDYISTHTDNVLVVALDPTSIFNKLKETYMIKDFGAPKFYLFCD